MWYLKCTILKLWSVCSIQYKPWEFIVIQIEIYLSKYPEGTQRKSKKRTRLSSRCIVPSIGVMLQETLRTLGTFKSPLLLNVIYFEDRYQHNINCYIKKEKEKELIESSFQNVTNTRMICCGYMVHTNYFFESTFFAIVCNILIY